MGVLHAYFSFKIIMLVEFLHISTDMGYALLGFLNFDGKGGNPIGVVFP